MKRVLTSCLVVLICLTAFITGYCKGCYSYAEEISYMTDEELEAGINAYIEAKGGSMLGTVGARMAYAEGKLYNFLTSSDNATPIKTIEDLKSGLSWNRQAIEGMDDKEALMLSVTPTANSFLASYLVWLRQQHYFGDNVTENENGMFEDGTENNIYSGEVFMDDENNTCLVFYCTKTSWGDFTQSTSGFPSNYPNITKMGTFLKYQPYQLKNMNSAEYHIMNHIYTLPIYKSSYYDYWSFYNVNNDYQSIQAQGFTDVIWKKQTITYNGDKRNNDVIGGVTIIKVNNSYYATKLFYGHEDYIIGTTHKYNSRSGSTILVNNLSNTNIQNTEINFYTNNNNNVLVFPTIENDGTLYITPKVNVGVDGEINYQPYIINEGDTITNVVNNYYTDSGTKDKTITVPSDNPDTGGGGSSDNPSGGTPPDWSNNFPHLSPDGEGGFNFNFTLPDLNIDWNINGLTEKFPFSIPFDLIHFVQVLNAEPETPEFDWTIDLKIYQWHIDADLHQFDNLAGIVRNVEFIGFCITLVMITRRMIKG